MIHYSAVHSFRLSLKVQFEAGAILRHSAPSLLIYKSNVTPIALLRLLIIPKNKQLEFKYPILSPIQSSIKEHVMVFMSDHSLSRSKKKENSVLTAFTNAWQTVFNNDLRTVQNQLFILAMKTIEQ